MVQALERIKPVGELDPHFQLPEGADEFGFVLGAEFGRIVARMETDYRQWYEPIHPENTNLFVKWAWRLHRSVHTEPLDSGWITLCVDAGRIGS